jgi:hypothetical protein
MNRREKKKEKKKNDGPIRLDINVALNKHFE